jgi:hypothetical protein
MSTKQLTEEEMKLEIVRLQKESDEFLKTMMQFSNHKEDWKRTVNIIAKEVNLSQKEINLLLESDDEN